MEDDEVLTPLLGGSGYAERIARMMHPGRLSDLIARLGDQDASLQAMIAMPGTTEQVCIAGTLALQACEGLRAARTPTTRSWRLTARCGSTAEPLRRWRCWRKPCRR